MMCGVKTLRGRVRGLPYQRKVTLEVHCAMFSLPFQSLLCTNSSLFERPFYFYYKRSKEEVILLL